MALLDVREEHHVWARETLTRQPTSWRTCESVVSEAFFLLPKAQATALDRLLRGQHLVVSLSMREELDAVLALRAKYNDVPMSLAGACLVRMSEILPDPVIVTTDSDFRIYRRHSRQVVPCLFP